MTSSDSRYYSQGITEKGISRGFKSTKPSSDSWYYSQGIAEKRNLTRVQVDNDLVRFKVLQPRNHRKMNLTRVQIDKALVRFMVLQPRNRRKKESDEGSSRQCPRQIQGIT